MKGIETRKDMKDPEYCLLRKLFHEERKKKRKTKQNKKQSIRKRAEKKQTKCRSAGL